MWGSIWLKSNFTLFQASAGYNEHRCVVRTAALTEARSHSSHTHPNFIFPSCIYFHFPVALRSGLALRGFAITPMGHATLGKTPLHEWSARSRDFFLTVWIRKTNWMSHFVFFISPLIVAQHVSGNHVPIIRSWLLRDVIASCWYVL